MTAILKDGPYSWFYLAITLVASFFFIGLTDSIGILVAVFIERLNETNAKGGWIGSMIYFLAMGLSPLVVYIHERISFRWCMLIASLLFCFSMSITPFLNNFYLVLFGFSVPFGLSISFVSTLSIVTQREYFDKHFGLAVGLRYTANAVGTIVLSFILPIILSDLGYKMTFLSLLIFSPVPIVFGMVARHQPRSSSEKNVRASVFSLWREFLQDKSFALDLMAVAIYFLICFVPLIYMVRYGVTLGYSLSKAKWLLIVRGISTVIARFISGRVGDIALKHGKVKLIMEVVVISFGLLNFACSFIRSFYLLIGFMVLIGIVEGVCWVSLSLFVVEITGGYHYNEAFSFLCLTGAVFTLAGTPFLGWIFDLTNNFNYVFYSASVICLISFLLMVASSKVHVENELSLRQKGQLEKQNMLHLDCENVDVLDENPVKLGAKPVYETTV